MTTADSGTQVPPPPTIRPLLRSRDDRVLAGVAGGLGRWLDIDPVIFRVTFAVLTLFGGLGLVGYLVGYLLIPEEATGVALVSSRRIPDLRRLTPQQRALLGWGAAGVAVLIAIAGHRSTTVAVLIIVAAVIFVSARERTPRSAPYGPQREYAYSPPPGETVPPSAAFAGPPTWQTQQGTWRTPSTPQQPVAPPQFTVRSRGRRLNQVLVSATVLAIGVYLLIGQAGAYDPTVLPATAIGLTVLGLGLAATAWYARSRGAVALGVVLTALVLAGSAVHGDYGTSVGTRTWVPRPGAPIPYEYRLAAGNATLDLRDLGPAAHGKTLRVTMGAGKLTVLVPDGLPFSSYAHVQAGSYQVFGERFADDPLRQTVTSNGWTPATGIRLLITLKLGNVEVDHG
jgi:phage shock protein PspC (stress-responsive transcriptional regulator)